MTQDNFETYIKANDPLSIRKGEFQSVVIEFKNGETIDIHAGIDDLVYYYSGDPKPDARKLIDSLQSPEAKQIAENHFKKYANFDEPSVNTASDK